MDYKWYRQHKFNTASCRPYQACNSIVKLRYALLRASSVAKRSLMRLPLASVR
ncbi:Uncharacterised protein [Citrobacter koseri]|nr:Uncharacterised protein [Citrobacter koseri]STT21733.1 Uncharacterised protein [Citrobacter koseri]